MTAARADDLIARHIDSLRDRTQENYVGTLRAWRAWLETRPGTSHLVDADGADVQAWVSRMLDDRVLRVRSVRSRVHHLRGIYDLLTRERVIDTDPTRWVTMPRAPRRADRLWLTPAEVRAVLAASWDAPPVMTAAVHLWTLSGLRPAEPLTVRVEDVTVRDGVTLLRVPARKGGDADLMSLSAPTAAAVERAVDGRARGLLLMHPRLDRGLDLVSARAELRKIASAAGVDPKLTPYGLRHTFITLSLEAGVPERDVAISAGHATSAMIPTYDRLRATVSVDRNATHRLTHWILDGRDGGVGSDPGTVSAALPDAR